MHKCAFYECHTCKVPFFGGLTDCENEQTLEESKKQKEDIHCSKCLLKRFGFGQKACAKHHSDSIDTILWKCMYCCSEAAYICQMGKLHLCSQCKVKNDY